MASLPQLPVEMLLLIEYFAKATFINRKLSLAPSLQLSWGCQQLRAVFMPRFWSFVVLDSTHSLAALVKLIKRSQPNAFREHVKYLAFTNIGGGVRLDPRLYSMDPTPSADTHISLSHRPIRIKGEASSMCGPREDETWPTPTQLVFNDPRRYFKLAGRKTELDEADESDETGSSNASEAEEEELKCTVCHPVMYQLYRHRIKPDDYWLPGAVHSIGPLQWNRRTWGRYRGPDRRRDGTSGAITTIEDFVTASSFLMDQLDFELLRWSVSFPLPISLCRKLAQHPAFHKLGISGNGGDKDCFNSRNSRANLLLVAPRITVLQEFGGTAFGNGELDLELDDEDDVLYLPLTDYSHGSSMRGFLDFLLAAKRLKHLHTACIGAFFTPCLLGMYAKLHSLHWNTLTSEPYEHVLALSRLRSSLWQLAKAVGRPDHMLEAADVQLLADSDSEHAEIAANVSALSDWLEQEELAGLVAQGWNEQEERGPNDSPVFYPPCLADSTASLDCSDISTAYEKPTSISRG